MTTPRRSNTWFGHGLPYLPAKPVRGHLIVIEGTDGVGRSTQIGLLRPWLELEGYPVSDTGWIRSPLLSETIKEAKAGRRITATTLSLLYAADFADRLEHEILPALQAGFIVIADRYMYTAFARNAVMGADTGWTRDLFGMALVPDLVLYLRAEVEDLVPRVLQDKGMDYWESGMHLSPGSDLFDSFLHYQRRLIAEYDRLAQDSGFITVDARRSIDQIQSDLRHHVAEYLRAPRSADTVRPVPGNGPVHQVARAAARLHLQNGARNGNGAKRVENPPETDGV
jgi:dTMP kinase